jgi:hypothetical protein
VVVLRATSALDARRNTADSDIKPPLDNEDLNLEIKRMESKERRLPSMKLTDEQKAAIAESVIVCYHNGAPYLRFCPLETCVFRFGLSINLHIGYADGAFQIADAKSAVVEYLVDSLESLLSLGEKG